MEHVTDAFEGLGLQAVAFLPRLIAALVIFAVGVFLSGFVARSIHRLLTARKVDPELSILLRRIVKISLMMLTTIVSLQQIDFEVTAFVAGLGIVGFTVGFALQDVSKHLVAGVLLLLQQPFEIGDAIEVAGHAGVVEDISLRATELRTFDGLLVLIPNGDVYVKPIRKFGRGYYRRVQLTVKVQTTDTVLAKKTVLERVLAITGVIPASPTPRVMTKSLTATASELVCYFWVDLELTGILEAQDLVIESVRDGFLDASVKAESIAIAVPAPDVFGGVGGVA